MSAVTQLLVRYIHTTQMDIRQYCTSITLHDKNTPNLNLADICSKKHDDVNILTKLEVHILEG